METTSDVMEQVSRDAWSSPEAVSWYGKIEGFIDPGERVAFERVIPDARNNPVLDLGIGGGRTTQHLLPLTQDYVGVDYTPEMIEGCRRRFAGVHFEEADARDLYLFEDESFQLVLFSFNGIDTVDLEGRKQVLAEAYRVLRPGGAFFFSTFNRNGPDFDRRAHLSCRLEFTWNPLRLATRTARFLVNNAVTEVRRRRLQRFEAKESGHGILLHSAHNGILVYASTQAELEDQLAEAGFASSEVIGGNGGETLLRDFGSDETHVHVIARKPAR
jgi:SAM-dependent methyltransferase